MNVAGLEADLHALRSAIREERSNRKVRTILNHWYFRTRAVLDSLNG